MQDAAAIMSQDEKHEEHLEGRRGDDEEIHGHQVFT
jgi:hypothetical protein